MYMMPHRFGERASLTRRPPRVMIFIIHTDGFLGPRFSAESSLVVAVQLLLSLLGAGIGLGTVNTNLGSTPTASSLGIGAGVWWVVSSCIALGLV